MKCARRKFCDLKRAAVLSFGALLLFVRTASSQPCTNIPIDGNDGLAKSSQNYKLLYETDDVRVLEAVIGPHASQTMHSFTRPAVLYLQTSVTSKTYSPGIPDPIEHVEEKPFQPVVVRIGPSSLHFTQNLSRHVFRGLRIELKHPGCGLQTGPSGGSSSPMVFEASVDTRYRVLYEDKDVRIADVWITNIAHLHSRAVLGFYYIATEAPKPGMNPNQTNESRDSRILPFASVGRDSLAIGSSGKPMHVIQVEMNYARQFSTAP